MYAMSLRGDAPPVYQNMGIDAFVQASNNPADPPPMADLDAGDPNAALLFDEEEIGADALIGAAALATSDSAPAPRMLPAAKRDSIPLVLGGVALLAVGLYLVARSRRR